MKIDDNVVQSYYSLNRFFTSWNELKLIRRELNSKDMLQNEIIQKADIYN